MEHATVKFRSTLVLLAMALALGGYVVLVELKKPAPQPIEATSRRAAPTVASPLAPVLTFDSMQATALHVTQSDGQRCELAYHDGSWFLVVPLAEEADQGRVTMVIESLASLVPQRVLTGTLLPADVELDPPAVRVEVGLGDGSWRRISLGAQNPARSAYYGQVEGDTRIYLFPQYVGSDIERLLSQPPVKPTPSPTVAGTPLASIPAAPGTGN